MTSEKGNVYLGEVKNVVISYRAAFVDYGSGRDGFLPFDEILLSDKTKTLDSGEKVVRKNTILIVQVKKDATEDKGALLTSYVSLGGKYVVLMPNKNPKGVVSRKIEPGEEFDRLSRISEELAEQYQVSLVLRTEAEGKTKAQLEYDLEKLIRGAREMQKKSIKVKAPVLIYDAKDVNSGGLFHKIKALFFKNKKCF